MQFIIRKGFEVTWSNYTNIILKFYFNKIQISL
jgi:hypothetical protein